MKVSVQNKAILFEQELLALLFIIVLGLIFNYFKNSPVFYFITLGLGFLFYFWMIYEEGVHTTGKKHVYFEHTSSYVMVAQTALALELMVLHFNLSEFLIIIFLIISVVMYSVSLSRMIMYKVLFKDRD